MALFAVPFAAAGAYAAWMLASTVISHQAARAWVETPAEVVSADLRGAQGAANRVLAEYRYAFEGREFTSDQVALTDSLESKAAAKRMHERLAAAKADGESVTAYVDPESPDRAVLYRDFPWRTVLFLVPMVVCFGAFGGGMLVVAVYLLFKSRREGKRRALYPNEPWRARTDWEAGVIRSSDLKAVARPVLIALFWNALCVPAFLLYWFEGDTAWWIVAAIGAFVVMGFGFVAFAVHRVLRYATRGSSTLRLGNTPGVIGGELAGVVMAPAGLRPADGFRVKLACLQTAYEGYGEHRSERVLPVWEDERSIDQTLSDASGKVGVPVRFTIPSDALPSDPNADLPVVWRLTAKAEVPGPDYLAKFDVPVYRTPDSREGVVADSGPLTEFEREQTLAELLGREGIRCDEGASRDTLKIVCEPFKKWGEALLMLVIGMVSIFVAVTLAIVGGGWGRWFGMPFAGLFGIGFLLGSAGTLLGCSDLRITGRSWSVRSGWYGFRGGPVEFDADEVRDIKVQEVSSSSSAADSEAKQQKHLIAELKDDRKLVLVRSVASRSTERRLLDELRRRAELSD